MFLLCNCIRTLRKDEKKHRSMMINVSALNAPQKKLAECVSNYVDNNSIYSYYCYFYF